MPRTIDEFWTFAEASTSIAKHMVDTNVQVLATADLAMLQSVLIQYRWFTSYYTGDLAILIYKLPPSKLRSLLAEFLNEELGNGDASKTHPIMYDKFLAGLGVDPEDLEEGANVNNLALLDAMRHKLLVSDYMFGIGLRGMGAECLCQVYLQAVHHYLMKNPIIQRLKHDLDWEFWNIHASEADQMHGEMARQGIERLTTNDNIKSLATGYLEAERMFKLFWDNAHQTHQQRGRVGFGRRRDRIPNEASLPIPLDGLRFDPNR